MPTRPGAQLATRVMTVALARYWRSLSSRWFLFAKAGAPYRVTLRAREREPAREGQPGEGRRRPGGLGLEARARRRRARRDRDRDRGPRAATPLHEGTTAEVRSTSLAGVANRYIALTPGRSASAEIAERRRDPGRRTRPSEVDLDQLLNTLDPADPARPQDARARRRRTRSSGRGRQLGRAIDALNPALSQVDALERELLRDQGRFARFLVESARRGVARWRRASRSSSGSWRPGARRSEEIAARDDALDSLLRRLPGTLRTTNTTLVNLRAALARRASDGAARPAGRRSARRDARPASRRDPRCAPGGGAARAAPSTGPGAADLIGVLQRAARARARRGAGARVRPPRPSTTCCPIVTDAAPVRARRRGRSAERLRRRPPAATTTRTATTRGSRSSRTSYSLRTSASLLPVPPSQPGLTGYRRGVVGRCPGAATQPAPDRSNPWVVPGLRAGGLAVIRRLAVLGVVLLAAVAAAVLTGARGAGPSPYRVAADLRQRRLPRHGPGREDRRRGVGPGVGGPAHPTASARGSRWR